MSSSPEYTDQSIEQATRNTLSKPDSRRGFLKKAGKALLVASTLEVVSSLPPMSEISKITRQLPDLSGLDLSNIPLPIYNVEASTAEQFGGYTSSDRFTPVELGSGPHDFQASRLTEASSYHPNGSGISDVMRKFRDAHYAATQGKEDVTEYINRFIQMIDGGLRGDQGICTGRAASQILQWGDTPNQGTLAGFAFNKSEIQTLMAVLHFADAPSEESPNFGNIDTPIVLDYLVRKYLYNQTGFMIDISPNHETWTYPIDLAKMIRTPIAGGLTRVNLKLQASNYTEPAHRQYDIAPGVLRRQFNFEYKVKDGDFTYLGEFYPGSQHLKAAFYPDPRGWVANAGGSFRVRDNVFTPNMVRSLDWISGGIAIKVCTKANPNCGF